MKVIAFIVSLTLLMALASAQRGSYAGSRPITNGMKGPYPEQQQQTNLDNRFNDNSIGQNGVTPVASVPEPGLIPQYNPYNNWHLYNQAAQQPVHQQPFWLLNHQAIQNHLNNPQPLGVQPLANRGSFMGRRRR